MTCAWEELLKLLPPPLRSEADSLGREALQELRLRMNAPPEYVLPGGSRWGRHTVSRQTLEYCVNAASRYSPWAAATAAQGYITAPGGHRLGLCGEAVCRDGHVTGLRELTSVNLRVARDFPGIGAAAMPLAGSTLVLGAPGWGKTTLLRDIARQLGRNQTVGVVDERGELFPMGFARGRRMDVLSLCPKAVGVEMLLKTMTPQWIAVDEITSREDAMALLSAAGCGVRLLATAHGAALSDLGKRAVYRELMGVFQAVLLLKPDKSYRLERMDVWATN